MNTELLNAILPLAVVVMAPISAYIALRLYGAVTGKAEGPSVRTWAFCAYGLTIVQMTGVLLLNL